MFDEVLMVLTAAWMARNYAFADDYRNHGYADETMLSQIPRSCYVLSRAIQLIHDLLHLLLPQSEADQVSIASIDDDNWL